MKHILFSEAGGHPNNEDAASLHCHSSDTGLLIGALADGQGGHVGGAQAAHIAVRACLENAARYPPSELADPWIWVECCETADRAVSADSSAGLTTLIGIAVTSNSIAGASSGESAAALWMGGRLTVLTNGQLKNPPIGSGAARLTPFSALLNAPWKLLVMSDGVWKYVGWERIGQRVATHCGQDHAGELRHDALGYSTLGLPDDFTVMVIES